MQFARYTTEPPRFDGEIMGRTSVPVGVVVVFVGGASSPVGGPESSYPYWAETRVSRQKTGKKRWTIGERSGRRLACKRHRF